MIVDSSALVAIVMGEPGSDELLSRLRAADEVGMAAPTLVESAMVLSSRLGGDCFEMLMELLEELNVEVLPFTKAHAKLAAMAFLEYGKGRHRAALNFGDCLTYAIAARSKRPVLFTGEDFAKAGLKRWRGEMRCGSCDDRNPDARDHRER
ncbi:MAG: type II toxin-antitoxin system VapC family toxin [Acidobacteria bacterium]|nr:type II toxin-antitoxin system VapC family toxin [Acidobacteriota bacterium]